MKHKKTSFAILFGLLSLSLAVSGSATWIITSPTINGGPSNIREDNSVCYINETGYYYSSLEGAIKDANKYVRRTASNATVVVIPNKTVYINNDTTLHPGVDLLMPYTTDYSTTLDGSNNRVALGTPEMTEIRKGEDGLYIAKYLYTYGGNNYPNDAAYKALAEYDTAVKTFADDVEYDSSFSTKLQSTLIINNDVELTISNGSQFVIYGQLGQPNQGLSGYTSGYYSQAILMPNSRINVSNGGILDVRGFIKEGYTTDPLISSQSKNVSNGSAIINNGKVYTPFIIYDYEGGTRTVGTYSYAAECPFTMYDLPNISVNVNTHLDGSILGRTDLYTGYTNARLTEVFPQHNTCFISAIGSADGNIIRTSNNTSGNSVVSTKYYPNSYIKSNFSINNNVIYYGLTQNKSTSTNSSSKASGRTTDDNYGSTTSINISNSNIDIGYLNLDVSVFAKRVPITTDGNVYHDGEAIYFPVPWQFDIKFNNSTINMSSDVKIMTGSSLTFENSTFNLDGNLIIYKNYTDNVSLIGTSSKNLYNYRYPEQQSAKFILDGSDVAFSANSTFSGDISLTNDSTQMTSLTINALNLSGQYDETTASIDTSDYVNLLPLLGFMTNPNVQFSKDILNTIKNASDPNGTINISLDTTLDAIDFSTNNVVRDTNAISGCIYSNSKNTNASFYNDYFDIPNLITDKVLEVTLNTASGQTASNWSEYNDQIIATINPVLASQYSVEWTISDREHATLTPHEDNPLIADIGIEKCDIDNGSYTATVTINITNEFDDNVVSNSIVLSSYGPMTTIEFINITDTVEGSNYNQTVTVKVTTDHNLDELSLVWTLSDEEYTTRLSNVDTTLDENGEASATLFIEGKEEHSRKVDLTVTVKFNNADLVSTTHTFTSDWTCLLPDTLITMADGSYKQVKDIVSGDEVMVFNHETGQIDTAPIFFNDYDEKAWYDVINLQFDNGKDIGVIYEHGFFDLTLNKYVYITNDNYKDFIGHEFYTNVNNTRGSTTLVSAYIDKQYTEVYSPVSYYHLNYFTEDVLSMPGATEYFVNIFPYDNNLKYDEAAKLEYISQYGLYTYDDFKDYVPFEFYNAFPAQYLKIQVEKGIISFDDILRLIDRYKEYL